MTTEYIILDHFNNNPPFIAINVTLSDNTRKFSGVQFHYETNYTIDTSNDYTNNNILNVQQNGIYCPSNLVSGFFSPVQSVMHNTETQFIVFIFKSNFAQLSTRIIYIPLQGNGNNFILKNIVISDDSIPARPYITD